MEYYINNKKLIWDFDSTNSSGHKLKDNNLYIENMWNMKDTVGYDDSCVGVHLVSDDTFYFVTFWGLGFTMQISENEVTCIKKQVTK